MNSSKSNISLPDLVPYIECLKEIKARYEIIISFVKGENHAMYDVPTIEVMALQFRMIFELIALGTLAAHKDIFNEKSKKFAKMYKPSDILKEVSRLNPDYYPQPIKIVKPTVSDEYDILSIKKSGYLTTEELIKFHGVCGNLLHARNPFGKQIDHIRLKKEMKTWAEKIVELLNIHKIKLLDDDVFHLVFLHTNPDGAIKTNVFQKVDKDGIN